MSSETNEAAVDALGRIQKEERERREKLEYKIGAGLPHFIRSINSTEAMVTIDPKLLPYKKVNGQQLADEITQKYQLVLETPDIVNQLIRVNAPNIPTDMGGRIELAMEQDSVSVEFVQGRFPTGGPDFVDINSLSFGSESIQANVSGLTDVAETLIAEAFEALWRASGAFKSWSSKDVSERIQMKTFATNTKTDFKKDLTSLFDESVRYYLQSSANNLGPHMIGLSTHNGFGPSTQVKTVLTLDELHFRASTFNLLTGRSQIALLRFSVRTRDEQGRGIIDVMSQLPFDKHVEFLSGLIEALK